MNTKFFTNKESNTLINKFEGVLANNGTINCFDVLVQFLFMIYLHAQNNSNKIVNCLPIKFRIVSQSNQLK